eukprot:TRINITY_DN577_c0_g1_i2.p1 TRINITY_DN577_c0_g1~~TRINITY_DN577_c0_g1_i2.p1  ORF type:complete len:514 (-),score=130.15 TRINITY_DN577_c0_g1_i2:293-1834(-)
MCIRDRGYFVFLDIYTMLILLETPAGYGLFKIKNKKKYDSIEDIYNYMQNIDDAQKLIQLEAFQKFGDTEEALKATAKLINGKLPKSLKKFIKKNIISKEVQDEIEVADKKLGKAIQDKFQIQCNSTSIDLFRALRSQVSSLVEGLTQDEMQKMTLGLAHGLSRYKLQFSVEKLDIMVVQAISLLDDLDKEINNYMMKLREWYGWHFPELTKIISDNLIYAKVVKMVGMRNKFESSDLSGYLPDDVEKDVKQAAQISMGTEIAEDDENYIQQLAQQVIELCDYREQLNEYLKNRMNAIAPNLSQLIGELVGARLIAHAGSLMNLAKYPASTIQILGAEKALFKAIRAKKNTPKYGLLYQASIVGSASQKIKGKISRTLASKCSLCIRCDALCESENAEIGITNKTYVEKRLVFLEKQSGVQGQQSNINKPVIKANYQPQQQRQYNAASDIQIGTLNEFKSQFQKAADNDEPQNLKRKPKQQLEQTEEAQNEQEEQDEPPLIEQKPTKKIKQNQ